MDTPTTPVLAILQAGFARMPAAIFAGLMLALLGIWLWAGLAAWRSASANGAAARSTSCRLRPSWGLLLVSGVSERDAAVLHALWLAAQLPLAVGCLVLALWGGRVHLSTYPGTPAQVRAGFAEALMTFPLENDPGLELEVRQERAAAPGR